MTTVNSWFSSKYSQREAVIDRAYQSHISHHGSESRLHTHINLERSSLTSSKTLGPKAAAALDQELMSTCAFSVDQLMELAGLSVSQAGE